MLEQKIKSLICKVECGDERGTGFAFMPGLILTARHCVIEAITGNAEVSLTFLDKDDTEQILSATIAAENDNLDVCVLKANTIVRTKIGLMDDLPREGADWLSFGYPQGKAIIHRLAGEIATTMQKPKAKSDIDLTIDPQTKLDSYKGLSGAPVIVNGRCAGILREKLNGSVAAISGKSLRPILEEIGLSKIAGSNLDAQLFAHRRDFQQTFEDKIIAGSGKYHFLGGPHGIGKTTFCEHFQPVNTDILCLGAFCVRDWQGTQNVSVRSRPDVFFDWLLSSISSLLSGKAGRQESPTYSKMAEVVSQLLEAFSDHCKQLGKRGVVFIDGLDEVAEISGEQLSNFVGILPTKLPAEVAIVFCSPNFSSVRPRLGERVGNSEVVQVPPLPKEACQQYCFEKLEDELKDLSVVNRICERANGHPLYLNYLIRYLNAHPEDKTLQGFPVLDSDIEEYYERIWDGLRDNENDVTMLAIISRLRQPLPSDHFVKLLNQTEVNSFSNAFARIQHLFLDGTAPFIYHSSFSAFSRSKTEQLGELLESRLACFCLAEPEVPYCVLNRLYHLLNATKRDKDRAINECNQKWIDNCVLLHAQPDTLLADLESVLKYALRVGNITGTMRLLLLSNRLSFRYNTLFAQAACSNANALIAIGNVDSAMDHVVRYGHLIVDPEEVLSIAFLMAGADAGDKGLQLLDLLEQNCIEVLGSSSSIELNQYVYLTTLVVQTLLMKCYIDMESRFRRIVSIQQHTTRVLEQNIGDSDPELVKRFFGRMTSYPSAHYLALFDHYISNCDLNIPAGSEMTSQRLLDKNVELVLGFIEATEELSLPKTRDSLPKLFIDIKSGLLEGAEIEEIQIPFVVDALIRLGANQELVNLASQGCKFAVVEIALRDENGIDANCADAYRAALMWRFIGFTNKDCDSPPAPIYLGDNWIQRLENLFPMLLFCEGRARLALCQKDDEMLNSSMEYFFEHVLNEFEFSLRDRIKWERSYAIPESTVPILTELATEFVVDCSPDSLARLFDWAISRSKDQFGIYSEGFRDCIFRLAEVSTRQTLEAEANQKLFQLLQGLKKHILVGVENRHELVPAILKLIPLFKKVGAVEVASDLYRKVLDFSMGPTWYKEDQFSLLSTGLAMLSKATDVSDRLPMHAALLEIASGEMTFQRYVRNEKAELIGLLASRERIDLAIAYFKAQSLGEPERLFYQWENSKIDAPEPRMGRGRPGGAIEDQHSILELVRNAESSDWKLRWALLEVFQFGDFRHVSDYGVEYAKIANAKADDDESLSTIKERISLLIDGEIPDANRKEFFNAFSNSLNDGIKTLFEDLDSFCQSPSDEDMRRPPPAERELTKQDREDYDEKFFMPGTFGKHSTLKDAETLLAEAKNKLDLGNISEMKSKFVAAVRTVQDGGWPVWQRASEVMQIAEAAIKKNSESPSEVIQAFESVVLSERHAASWKIADHLIEVLGDEFDEETKIEIFDAIIEHVKLMVGEPSIEIEQFAFLGKPMPQSRDNDELLFKFILWFANHPNWIRREKAAELSLWLTRCDSNYIRLVAKEAFHGGAEFSADLACGILEVHSKEQPDELWGIVEAAIDTSVIVEELSHVGRLATLLRLADRTTQSTYDSAKNVKSTIKAQTLDGSILIPESGGIELPKWAICVEEEWRRLELLGVVSAGLLEEVEDCLSLVCEPYSLSEIHDLEDEVSTTFCAPHNWPLNRWKSKVHFALNRALLGYVGFAKLYKVEEVIRVFNPNAPCEGRTPFFASRYHLAKKELQQSGSFSRFIGDESNYFLHYIELAEDVSGDGSRSYLAELEVTAVLIPSDQTRRGFFTPEILAAFDSRQWADQYPPVKGHEVVRSVSRDFVFFGSLTPALPSLAFLELAQCDVDHFERNSWRSGRSRDFNFFGRPVLEGSCISIPKNLVRLPKEKMIAWIVELNGRVVAMVDEMDNDLI